MIHPKTLLAAMTALALMLAPSAFAAPSYHLKHGHHCRKGYKLRHRQVKRHGRRHRIAICVKHKAPVAATAPAPKAVKLHAHLDPSYVRDPLNPFSVRYSYSASATQTSLAAPLVSEPAPLPSGVLSLYSDGKLECAVNVGSGVEESECPVTYSKLGEHRVTTIYTSGEQSATETEVERIEPLGTETSLRVSYEPLSPSQSNFGCGADSPCKQEAGWSEDGGFEIGMLTVEGKSEPWGEAPVSACAGGSDCRELMLGANGSQVFSVSALANYVSLEEKELAVGETLAIEPEAVQTVRLAGLGEYSASDIENGVFHFRVASPSHPGYSGSVGEVALRFSPQVGDLVERIPCSC